MPLQGIPPESRSRGGLDSCQAGVGYRIPTLSVELQGDDRPGTNRSDVEENETPRTAVGRGLDTRRRVKAAAPSKMHGVYVELPGAAKRDAMHLTGQHFLKTTRVYPDQCDRHFSEKGLLCGEIMGDRDLLDDSGGCVFDPYQRLYRWHRRQNGWAGVAFGKVIDQAIVIVVQAIGAEVSADGVRIDGSLKPQTSIFKNGSLVRRVADCICGSCEVTLPKTIPFESIGVRVEAGLKDQCAPVISKDGSPGFEQRFRQQSGIVADAGEYCLA